MVVCFIGVMAQLRAGDYQPFLNQPSGKVSPRVAIGRFFLDVQPVTQREFLAFVTAHREWRKASAKRIFAEANYLKNWSRDLHPDAAPDTPVTFVSWFAANAYCKAQGARLPTTDQWEYAATEGGRANREVSARILEWYGKPTPDHLPPATGAVNGLGVASLVGVVWEWTLDFSSAMISDEPREGGDASSRFFCGGGGASAIDPADYASFMRYAFRSSLKPAYTIANLGFRCAKTDP